MIRAIFLMMSLIGCASTSDEQAASVERRYQASQPEMKVYNDVEAIRRGMQHATTPESGVLVAPIPRHNGPVDILTPHY
jgi:hypothetical protein